MTLPKFYHRCLAGFYYASVNLLSHLLPSLRCRGCQKRKLALVGPILGIEIDLAKINKLGQMRFFSKNIRETL